MEVQKQLEQVIVDYVARVDWVSFAELPRGIANTWKHEVPLPELEGDSAIRWGEDSLGIVVWTGLSVILSEAIIALLLAKTLHLHPSQVLTYMIDGACLTLPIAKRIPKEGYRDLHWLPCTLRVVPQAKPR